MAFFRIGENFESLFIDLLVSLKGDNSIKLVNQIELETHGSQIDLQWLDSRNLYMFSKDRKQFKLINCNLALKNLGDDLSITSG